MAQSKISEMRKERERAAREGAEVLATVLEALDRAADALEKAGDPALYHRATGLRASTERLRRDVAWAVGDLVRERIAEEIAAATPPRPGRTLSVA